MITLSTRPQDDSTPCAVSVTSVEARALHVLVDRYWTAMGNPQAGDALEALSARAGRALREHATDIPDAAAAQRGASTQEAGLSLAVDRGRRIPMTISLREAWVFALHYDHEVVSFGWRELDQALASVERRCLALLKEHEIGELLGDLWLLPDRKTMNVETRARLGFATYSSARPE